MLKLQNRLNVLKEGTKNDVALGLVQDTETKLKNSNINPSGYRQFESFLTMELVKNLKEINEADKATTHFIDREERILALNNLEVKNQFAAISEAGIAKYPMVKILLEKFTAELSKPDYQIAESFVSVLQPFAWDETIKTAIDKVSGKINESKNDIKLQNTIDDLLASESAYIVESFKTELDSYYTDRTDMTRAILIEKLTKYSFDAKIQNLTNVVNETSSAFKLANASGHVNISDIYSPALLERDYSVFSLGTKYIKKSTDGELTVLSETEISKLPEWFTAASNYLANDSVQVKPGYIQAFAGDKKVEVFEENENVVIKLNDKIVSIDEFNKSFMLTGIFHKNEIIAMNEIHNVINNFENILHIDFAKRIEDSRAANKFIDVLSTNEGIYLSHFDARLKLNTFTSLNAIAAREHVLEHLNYDLGDTFREVLTENENAIKEIEDSRTLIIENLDLLKAKKNEILLLIEGNKSLDEFGELTDLIEILDNEINGLQSNSSKHNANIQLIKEGKKPEDMILSDEEKDVDECDGEGDGTKSKNGSGKGKGKGKGKTNEAYTAGNKVKLKDGKFVTIQSYKESQKQYIVLGTDAGESVDSYEIGEDEIVGLSESKINECKFNVTDKISVADGRIGSITGIDIPGKTMTALMDDGVTIDIPIERASEITLVKGKEGSLASPDPDGVQQLDDQGKTAVVETNTSDFIDAENLKNGEVITVDPLQYTSKGNNDKIDILINGKKDTLQKKFIKIS